MSLLNKTTSAQLGIGGDAGAFATGVKGKKKKGVKLTKEQTAANQTANEQGDARLAAQADVNVDYDPKADNAANLMLNTDDEAFISQVQQLKSDLFSGQYKGGGGARGDAAGFLDLANSSSRGGLGDVWNDTIAMLYKGDEIGPRKLALIQEQFTKAYDKTNSVLNLDVNMGTYKFDQGSGIDHVVGKDLIGEKGTKHRKAEFKAVKKETKATAKANQGVSAGAVGTFAWDVAAEAGAEQLGIDTRQKRGALSIR